MKMCDIWSKLPTYGIYDNATVNGRALPDGCYGMLFNNKEPAEALECAIKAHDQHLETIAQQTERIAALELLTKSLVHEAEDFCKRTGKSITWLNDAKQLLTGNA